MIVYAQDRRKFLKTIAVAGAGLSLSASAASSLIKEKPDNEEEVTPNEDLMREHGLLNRVLLIYDENLKRISGKKDPDYKVINASAIIIRDFIENYHEKLEEEFVFPALIKANKEKDLVDILKLQHDVGRKITARIIDLTSKIKKASLPILKNDLASFTLMYRAHESREDTVIFPAFKKAVGEKQYKELGERFEEREHKLFGEDGFEGMLKKVEALERQLGIADLRVYTPKL